MTAQPRVTADWLALREPADATARALELVEAIRRGLPEGPVLVHDLGSGTGSMGRWLAPLLPGPQHWVMSDRDTDLLAVVDPPVRAADGTPVTVQTRECDISRLDADDLAGASLVTASALLDMMTSEELDHVVATCCEARCPVLVTITVTGCVDLAPPDPLDSSIADAFNDHQRRTVAGRRLLGPDAVGAAVDAFTRLGHDVEVRPSPWRLGAAQSALAAEWLTGWVAAAREQRPDLADAAGAYARRRLEQAREGRLDVTLHHADLLARPR